MPPEPRRMGRLTRHTIGEKREPFVGKKSRLPSLTRLDILRIEIQLKASERAKLERQFADPAIKGKEKEIILRNLSQIKAVLVGLRAEARVLEKP